MGIQRATPVNEFLAKLIFLVLPTAGVAYFLLEDLNQYFSILKNDAVSQTLYFAAGMGIASLFYSFRFRFLPAFLLLALGLYSIYKGLDNAAVGEFDAFFIARRFQNFAILLVSGWLMGWGFIRLRYWSVFISVTMLCGCIYVVAKSKVGSVNELVFAFSPAVLYSVYIIFATEQIYNYKDKSKKFWWFLTGRLALFTLFTIFLLGGVTYMMRFKLQEAVANGGGGQQDSTGMLKKKGDGSFDLKNFQKLKSSQGRGNDLLFCAHIDNYFPGTTEPNPLYLTAFYFTKFDTATETFERDATVPSNDLFEPDPSKIPLFATKMNTGVVNNTLGIGSKYKKIVEMQLFSKSLSPETYLAPNVGYFVQPITVEKDFREVYKTAYRAKSYVSELNSAYFVYNINKPEWRKFQEMRNEVLRKVIDYKGVDSAFMAYYTKMPSNANFKKIATLAHSIMDTPQTPVDKVLAIRDYFLGKDENGDPLYQYTDNPGEPDIPNASKLMYFLFENHKGYCAYYAGATLFMLRAMGIPSRIAVGFLTENRSDKNKGWYFYYSKQAHAWVQVYFPGLGWLDFDTTVGNNDAHESPTPDGTPPMQPPKAWLAADGEVVDVDTLKKIMQLQVKQFVFHDKDYKLPIPVILKMDMKVALVYRDSITVPLKTVNIGDGGTAVSYAEALKNIEPTQSENSNTLIKRLPAPAPIDEVYLKSKPKDQPKENIAQQQKPKQTPIKTLLARVLVGAMLLLVLVFASPYLIYLYFKTRYKNAKPATDQPYWAYMVVLYYLHMLGIHRGKQTPMQYAREAVDSRFGTNLTGFMNIYLKKKYAKQTLNNTELAFVSQFLDPCIVIVKTKVPFKYRLSGFLNIARCVGFFVEKLEGEEK